MQHKLFRPPAHRAAFIIFLLALLAAAAGLLCGCGGADEGRPARDDSAAETVLVDLAELGSIETAVDHAARAHGAPGEDERLRYVVRARSRSDGEQLAEVLTARGFAPVFQISETQP